MEDYSPPPLPTLWDWIEAPLRRAEYHRRYPTQQATITDAPPLPAPQQAVVVPGPVPQHAVFVQAPQPQQAVLVVPQPQVGPLTPKERAALKKTAPKTTNVNPAPQGKSKKRFGKGTPLALGVPDVGGYLGTIPTHGHGAFADIVFFTLNNHPGYTEIHVHRNAAGHAVQISMKYTGMNGNGVPVQNGSALFNEADIKGRGI